VKLSSKIAASIFLIVCKSSPEKDYTEVGAIAEGEGEDDGEEY